MCDFEACRRPVQSLGFCKAHYDQRYRGRQMRNLKTYTPTSARDEHCNKWCGTCETWRPESDFAKSAGKVDGLQSRCRSCNAAIYRARAADVRDQMRMHRMNVSRERFDAMLADQGGRCAICRSTDPGSAHWAVDHDHACCGTPGRSCGRCVRGLLCSRCNAGIGHLRDDPAILDSAAVYLRTWARATV